MVSTVFKALQRDWLSGGERMKSKQISTRNYWSRLINGIDGKDRAKSKHKKAKRQKR